MIHGLNRILFQIHYSYWIKKFLKDKIQSVQLCFSTDPFMYRYDEIVKMSIAAIKKLNAAGIKCTTLTKGLLPIELATLSKDNEHGITARNYIDIA